VFISQGNPNPLAEAMYNDGPPVQWQAGDILHLIDLYDEEISYFDQQFSLLLQAVEDRGLLDESIIVLVSDHGEDFLEHGHLKHCRSLFDTSTWTPLIMSFPGGGEGMRIEAPVQNMDIVPTLVDFLQLDVGPVVFNGSSLMPLILGQESGRRVAFSRQSMWRSVDDGRLKVLLNAREMQYRMFNLHEDPGERNDIFHAADPRAMALTDELHRWMKKSEGGVGRGRVLDADLSTEEQLRALGYLQ